MRFCLCRTVIWTVLGDFVYWKTDLVNGHGLISDYCSEIRWDKLRPLVLSNEKFLKRTKIMEWKYVSKEDLIWKSTGKIDPDKLCFLNWSLHKFLVPFLLIHQLAQFKHLKRCQELFGLFIYSAKLCPLVANRIEN